MAGKKVYTGVMIEDLITKIDAMMTTMVNQITELQKINTSVSQGIQALNVKDGAGKIIALGNTLKSNSSNSAYVVCNGFKVFCNGVLRMNYAIRTSNTGMLTESYYRRNGGAWVLMDTTSSTSGSNKQSNVPVSNGDVVDIGIKISAGNSGIAYYEANATASYDVLDVVNGGAISIIS